MPSSREGLPEGAPADLFEFIRQHPGTKIGDAILALNLPRATAYYALARLRKLRLIHRRGRWSSARWHVVEKKPPDPSGAEQRHAALADCAALMLSALSTDSIVHPTGTPIDRAGGVQVFGISGPHVRALEYSHQGGSRAPGELHPWSYLGNYRPKHGG